LLVGTAVIPNLVNSRDGKSRGHFQIPIKFHVTFPHIKCHDLDMTYNGASGENFRKQHGKYAVKKRVPTVDEIEAAGFGDVHKLIDGCSISGRINVPKVAGNFGIHVTRKAWQIILLNVMFHLTQGHSQDGKELYDPFAGGVEQNGRAFNISHYIHYVDFGNVFPHAHHPLKDVQHIVRNQSGLGISTIFAKLIPTVYKRVWRSKKNTYQISIADHFVHPATLASQNSPLVPGITFSYDFTPLEVNYTEEREGFLTFLGSLISIVGGVFVTVRLLSSVLVETVNISKKRD